MMAMSLHQLLLLVGVTALMLVVNLPCCWSQCDITAARRQAQKIPGQKMSPGAWLSKTVARRAARKAGVKQHDVVEAYYLVRYIRGFHSILLNMSSTSAVEDMFYPPFVGLFACLSVCLSVC